MYIRGGLLIKHERSVLTRARKILKAYLESKNNILSGSGSPKESEEKITSVQDGATVQE